MSLYPPLLPLPRDIVHGRLLRRVKRFSVEVACASGHVWAHTNNSGAMTGLVNPGTPVVLSKASNKARKLPYTLEKVCLYAGRKDAVDAGSPDYTSGTWVGVNTHAPNNLLEAAFKANKLEFASGYTSIKREVTYGQSRLDGCFYAPGLPSLWVECKSVTLVEDCVAGFPDAPTQRGRKHLWELMEITRSGGRAAMFFLVQRADARCFAPADYVDAEYASLFYQACQAGVEIYPYCAKITETGMDLGKLLPVRPDTASL